MLTILDTTADVKLIMKKTPAVAYYSHKIAITNRKELYAELEDAPIKLRDWAFLSDIIEGLSNQELSRKYKKSPARISQWKRRIFEHLHEYDLHQARKSAEENRTPKN